MTPRDQERVDDLINQLASAGINRVRVSDRGLLEITRHEAPVDYYRWLVLHYGERPSFRACKDDREKASRSMRAMRATAEPAKKKKAAKTAKKKRRPPRMADRDPLQPDDCTTDYSRRILKEINSLGVVVIMRGVVFAEFVTRSPQPDREMHDPVTNYLSIATGQRLSISEMRGRLPYRFRAEDPREGAGYNFDATKSDIAVTRGLIHVARYLATQSSQDDAFRALARGYLSMLHLPAQQILSYQPAQKLKKGIDDQQTTMDAEWLHVSLPTILGTGEANCRLFLVGLFRSELYHESSLVVTPGEDRMPGATFLSDPLSGVRADLKRFAMFSSDDALRRLAVTKTDLSVDRLWDLVPEIEPQPKRRKHFKAGSFGAAFVSSFCLR